MPKIIENYCQIDAQNVVKSSLGGTLELKPKNEDWNLENGRRNPENEHWNV